MKRLISPLSMVIALCLLLGVAVQTSRAARFSAPPGPDIATPEPGAGKTGAVKQAILDAMQKSAIKAPALQIYKQDVERVQFSSDAAWARAWLVSIDPQTGEAAPSEPGLVLSYWDGTTWQVVLPSDPSWAQTVKDAPLNLLSQQAKDVQLEMMTREQVQGPTAAFTGYYLPWQAGQTKYLSQSIYHDYYTPSGTAHYAFDFYVHDQMWDILAAKPGYVWKYYDAVPTCYDLNCGQDLGNYMVVKDPTTNPVSYMLYLHLAQNSIPAELKHVGALVKQAQFLGRADNTGASWGDHLHFMVHTNPNSYWGQSVDIRFSDVTINGGRPRVQADKAFCTWAGDVCNTFQVDYTSFNTPVKDNTVPTAGITSPGNGDVIAARTVNINAWGKDTQAGMFNLQVFVNTTGSWQALTNAYFSPSLVYAWDWCTTGVPNGPVSLGVQATDLAGHVSDILAVRTITKSFSCPVTSAGIDLPLPGSVVTSRQVTVSGWGLGETGLAWLQALDNIDGTWQNLGPASTTSPYTFQWDLCNAGVPDGPVSLAFKATDLNGRVSAITDVHTFIKNYACPAPVPAADQVLICTSPDYGNCFSYGEGQYASGDADHPMDPLPEDSAYSIRVGSNVQATLYATKRHNGRALTFFADDPNLEDNLLRQETMRSFSVQKRNVLPSAPVLPTPSYAFQTGDVATLYWENAGGATEYQVQITGTLNTTTAWQALPYLYLTGLDNGAYTWKVQARNVNGVSGWSSPGTFTIAGAKASASAAKTAPYSDDMETSSSLWSSSGLWRLGSAISVTTPAHTGQHAWWYQDPARGDYDTPSLPNAGNLTSPGISIPAAGYSLRFWYYYVTETGYPYYDQRWVQISQDGGPFTNTLLLSFDPQATWLQSGFIDLSAYGGHTIRVRFHFDTLDMRSNNEMGWGIDDFSITQTSPPTCTDTNEPNNTSGSASSISYGAVASGQICPQGDVDYYKFNGTAGDVIGAAVDAQSLGSSLDPVLYLYNASGSLMTSNDDKIPHELLDSQIHYTLPQNGVYYLKVIAWDNPMAGGSGYIYHLSLYRDAQKPQITLQFPSNAGVIPAALFKVTASVNDPLSGISHVDFMWHSGDWVNDSWNTLGSDWTSADGWSTDFDGSSLVGQHGLAFYAQAFDTAGNSISAAAWNVSVIDDATPPSLVMQALPVGQPSTVVHLLWTASDTQSGIDHFDVQVSENNGTSWADAQTGVSAAARNLWYVGQQGHTYAFRMQAVDRAGNIRPYPSSAEVSIDIPANVCPSLDIYEPDNVNAVSILTDGTSQLHNFCNPVGGSSGLADEDWVTFTPQAGARYLILAVPENTLAGVKLSLYAGDKTSLLGQASSGIYGQATRLTWKAASANPVFVKMEHFNSGAAGSIVSYRVYVFKNYPLIYLPVLGR